MIGQGLLPVVFPPEVDERLSSWLARMAPFYAMTVPEFLAELGLSGRDVFALEWRMSEGEGARIALRTGLSVEAIQDMTFCEFIPDARMMVARRNRHHCPHCPTDVHRRSMSLPWVFLCPVHGADLQDTASATLPAMMGGTRMAALAMHAKAGSAVLDAWLRGAGQGALDAPEMLAVLTARHRRASPPSLAEQPCMSLQTRRDYHDFLTTPIIRQALTVVVPEYDEVAPVLAKPVRPSLHALAQGSLLQGFALTVGIGRIVEDPVACAINVLLASDVDGQVRVRDALAAWPLSLRRRISARLWRAQRDERERQSAAKPKKRRQSHEFRLIQSHEYRSRIS
ncbi:MAG: TniQ family protein [Marivita sp.]|uniref:TniQ family protein n=1 Tax=Marivita sp. TaxID=2003365 RepID=UPI0025BBE109|nr:TniQ family protein [Marivita sp.]MCI5111978.1 TniQ family protein [Marivita sp.]